MVIHNYDFTHIKMIRFHNTLTMISDIEAKYSLRFHLGHIPSKETSLLSCEEIRNDGIFDVYVPDVPRTTVKWTDTIKKQLSMILEVAQKYHLDYISIIVGGNARQEVAAIALHQALREFTGVMYMIEFCMPDQDTRVIYERTISPLYRS